MRRIENISRRVKISLYGLLICEYFHKGGIVNRIICDHALNDRDR